MLTGSTVLKRAVVIAALALPIVISPEPTSAATPDVGTTCTPEQWVWTGTAQLEAVTAEFDTGLIVPVIIGTTLTVTGISADGLDSTGHARPMTVVVGGTVAAPGATVPGGRIVVAGDAAPALLSGVTVVLDRCTAVQSAVPDTDAGSGTGSGSGPDLPGTGARSVSLTSLIGVAAVAAGTAMIVAGRRRPVG